MFDHDLSGCGALHHTCLLRYDADSGVNRSLHFHTCPYDRRLSCEERDRLTLHVGSHQRTVRIVVLEERDQSRSDREYHLRRNIHVIELVPLVFLGLFAVTTGYIFINKVAFFIQRRVRLCHMVIVFFIRSHVYNFVCDARVLRICLIYLAVRRLDEAVLIDPCISCKGVDKTDVRSLRRLDRTHSSVMGIVHVPDLESGTVSGKTSRSKG